MMAYQPGHNTPVGSKWTRRRRHFSLCSGQGRALLCREIVTMMQTAEPWHRDYPATWARSSNGIASCRGLLLQPKVRPVIVVVADIFGHQPFEVSLVEHDDMVEQVSPAIAHEALSI
jgi:hypothetical protein